MNRSKTFETAIKSDLNLRNSSFYVSFIVAICEKHQMIIDDNLPILARKCSSPVKTYTRFRCNMAHDYREKDKEVKGSLRKDKRDWINGVAREAEEAASQGQIKGVYKATKRLCNEGPRKVGMVKSKEGKLLTKEDEAKARWKEHFMEVLSRPVPEVVIEMEEADAVNNSINTGEITREEIRSALRDMKSGKAPGIDSITADLLRVDIDTTVSVLYEPIQQNMGGRKYSRGLVQGAYHQTAQERGLDELWKLERYHPHVYCRQGVGKSLDQEDCCWNGC